MLVEATLPTSFHPQLDGVTRNCTLSAKAPLIMVRSCCFMNPLFLILRPGREQEAEFGRKRGSPSEDATHTSRRTTQEHDGAIYDERPEKRSGPPIVIYHPVFAKFLSRAFADFDGDEDTLRETSLFISASRGYYDEEHERIDALGPSLRTLLHPRVLKQTYLYLEGDEYIVPDGHIEVRTKHRGLEREPICFFTEVKNEVGAGGCDPALQGQSDFVRIYSSNFVRGS